MVIPTGMENPVGPDHLDEDHTPLFVIANHIRVKRSRGGRRAPERPFTAPHEIATPTVSLGLAMTAK